MFDPDAVLAMLRAFYPVASAAALALALVERPAYFGAGRIVSTGRDKLELPTGEVWDLIFDVDGVSGGPAWQAIRVFPGDDADRFPLEPGPLPRIDVDAIPRPVPRRDFETLVAGHYSQLVGVDALLDGAAASLAAADGSAALRASFEEHVAPAAREIDGQLATDFEVDITPELEAIAGHGYLIDVRESEVEDPDAAPSELADVDPGDPPPEEPPPEEPEPQPEV